MRLGILHSTSLCFVPRSAFIQFYLKSMYFSLVAMLYVVVAGFFFFFIKFVFFLIYVAQIKKLLRCCNAINALR